MVRATTEPRRIISASVPVEDARRLEMLAREADRTLSAQIARMLRERLQQEEPRP